MALEIGTRLGPYEITARIGAGGMGEVYRAADTKLKRDVAIKILPEEVSHDKERLARFEREAHVLASLNHPNIASIYGLEESDGVPCLVLELVEGQTLAEGRDEGALPMDKALDLGRQITSALEAAHEKGIIHRDLKPANIKVTPEGSAKVLDFGLAKAFADESAEISGDASQSPTMTAAATRAGVILGTAAYMSPEQARGRRVDKRTDIWAFGCVLYEMLAGRGVFHAATVSDCIAGILEREPDWEALPPGTPSTIRKLLRRCLEKDPRRRLHDIADARIEIEEAAAGAPEAQPVRGRGARITWPAAGLVLGVVATALVVWQWMPPETVSRRSPGRLSVLLPPEAPVAPGPADTSVAISPDGTRLVYVSPAADGRTQLFSRRLDDYEVRAIEGTIGGSLPFFSPDGEWVGFFDSDEGTLKKTKLRGGVPVRLCTADARGASWGEDGRIYFGHPFGGIQAVKEDGGTPETLTNPDREQGEKTHRFPHVLPGGKGLLFTVASSRIDSYDEASVALLDLQTSAHRVLFDGGTYPSYVATGHILYGRGGSLEAVPFDPESMQVTGAPFTVAGGVVTSDGWGSAHYAVSHGGTLAYVPGMPEMFQSAIYWLDRNGNLEVVPLPPRPYGGAVFSPDGRRLALAILGGNASIWVYEIEREILGRLTTEWDDTGQTWMRSGSHVTFYSNRTGIDGIWRIPADGSGRPELLYSSKGVGHSVSWSVDDQWLAFELLSPTTGLDVWLLSAEQEWKAEPLFQTAFQEHSPVFSPDGRWLAYTSDETGLSELYVQRFPVTGRKWQISAGGGAAPLWSPDGRELYYWKQSRLMAVPVTTEPDFAPGKERELPQPEFSFLLDWDIAPDGKRFVVVGRETAKSNANVAEIRVVTDWFEEIRRGPS